MHSKLTCAHETSFNFDHHSISTSLDDAHSQAPLLYPVRLLLTLHWIPLHTLLIQGPGP
jgi:hypothetical protein